MKLCYIEAFIIEKLVHGTHSSIHYTEAVVISVCAISKFYCNVMIGSLFARDLHFTNIDYVNIAFFFCVGSCEKPKLDSRISYARDEC